MLRFAVCAVSLLLAHLPMGAETVPMLETSELKGFSELAEPRRKLIEAAIAAGHEVAGMPYKYGGNGPEDGGFDCSGAMYYILRKAGLKPPRTSSDQFLWIRENSGLHLVANAAKDTEDGSFSELKPGDLVFCPAPTSQPTGGRRRSPMSGCSWDMRKRTGAR